ncbi:MAG: LysE family transporter [Alicyclobacillus sp.]|nr:LysE family transporter [Alicyclobacillus sp.]
MIDAFVHGFLLSLGLILPIGMQNGFVLTQGSLHTRWRGSFPTVLTASLCDTLLTTVSVVLVGSLGAFLHSFRLVLGVIGVLFLLWMGASSLRRSVQSQTADAAGPQTRVWTTRAQVTFAASTSLLNPHAWMDTIAVIGGTALLYPAGSARLAFTVACVLVSWLWFFGLSYVGHLAGMVLVRGRGRVWMDLTSALLMWGAAAYLVWMLVRMR